MQASAVRAVDTDMVLGKATVRAAEGLGLSGKALAEVIGLSEPTVSRIKKVETGINPEGKPGELALLLVRTFRSLDALVGGDDDKRKLWMSTSNRELNGVPLQLVKKVDGLLRVLAYLDVMRAPS
jgi:hypothetical protein